MKKFIYHLFIYIGLTIAVVNPSLSRADTPKIPMDDFLTPKIDPSEPLIKTDNEFIKLYVVYLLVDKLYPEGKINQDITPFLKRVWPKTDVAKLAKFAPFLKTFIMGKRRYEYAVDRLKHKIKANQMLSEDAPIVAKDGEFAPQFPDEAKQTGADAYKVSYTPYKYIGYDAGELGEPVRLRDRNYEPAKPTFLDEVTLAILELDIGAFYRAIKKYPSYNDGSREKAVELGDGVRSRLLVDTVRLGDAETFKAVLEVYTPRKYYINGDYLNPLVKPMFRLSEDTSEDLNIKSFELFYPEAAGVVNDNKTSRILADSTLFPIIINRRDLNKPVILKGDFTFTLCQAKTKNCHRVQSHNRLVIAPSNKREFSQHAHYVEKGFLRIPPEKSQHATLSSAVFNPLTGKLTAKFNTTKTFSNVAVMAEDAKETNFINPRYSIDKNEVTVTFDSTPEYQDALQLTPDNSSVLSVAEGGEIALTAGFDKLEVLRTTITPEISTVDISSEIISYHHHYGAAFLFGLLLNLLPGVLYMLERLLRLLVERQNRYQIFARYALGTALGLTVIAVYAGYHPWYALYESPYLLGLAFLLSIAYLTELSGYMNFNLFRPLKGIIRRGIFIGLITILFATLSPAPYKILAFAGSSALYTPSLILNYLYIWIGILTLPFIFILCRRHLLEVPLKMHYLNKSYILLFILWILWLVACSYGWLAVFILILGGLLSSCVWYVYPLAINEAARHKRSLANKNTIFQIVQKHCTIAQSIIFIITILAVSSLPLKKKIIPTMEQISAEAEMSIAENRPLVFTLSAPWSLRSLANKYTLQRLNNAGVKVIQYTPEAENYEAQKWYQAYGKQNPPLNILFTSRHPRGLSLPSYLKKIDWNEASSDF